MKFGALEDVEAAATLPIPAGKARHLDPGQGRRPGRRLHPRRCGDLGHLHPPRRLRAPGPDPGPARPRHGPRRRQPDGQEGGGRCRRHQRVRRLQEPRTTPSLQRLVTVAVTQKQAEQVRFAEKSGESQHRAAQRQEHREDRDPGHQRQPLRLRGADMPVIVEADSASVPVLLAALPTGSHSVASVERMYAWLDQHPDEYVVVLGPSLDLDTALECAEEPADQAAHGQRGAGPRAVRHRRAGAVHARRCAGRGRRRQRRQGAHQGRRARPPGSSRRCAVRAAHARLGRVVTVFSPKGGVGKTTSSVNLALALTDRGARKVCLVDLDLAFGDVAITMQPVPDALDRAGRRLRGLHRPRDAGGPAHPARGLAHRAGRAGPPGRAGADHPAAHLPDPARAARRLRLRGGRHLAVLRRRHADRAGRDRRVRHHRHPRRTDPEEREGRPRDDGHALDRPRSPAPAAEPRRRRGRHQRGEGREHPRHAGHLPGRDRGGHRRGDQLRHPDRVPQAPPPGQPGLLPPGGIRHRRAGDRARRRDAGEHPGDGPVARLLPPREELMSSLSERLAAARREAAAQGRHAAEPGEGASAVATVAPKAPTAPATPAGPEPAGSTPTTAGPLSARAAAASAESRPTSRRSIANPEVDRIEELKSSVHAELLQQTRPPPVRRRDGPGRVWTRPCAACCRRCSARRTGR
ncbi:ParA family protein [Nocardioides sp. W3-2-3]|uniref:ParA family protein n=1 Tax=Nocardioides convexus TaxID=2712224 RepID=UPI0024188DD6|nr:ParA family protein [Nocardioides convexus]NHA00010.1 ParA family protein [Nocardioides convexus]